MEKPLCEYVYLPFASSLIITDEIRTVLVYGIVSQVHEHIVLQNNNQHLTQIIQNNWIFFNSI